MTTCSKHFDDHLCEDFVMVNHDDIKEKSVSKDYLHSISQHIEDISDDLRRISLTIHDNPELQFKEYHAYKTLVQYLSQQNGWKVTGSAYGIETAFVAVFDTWKEGPVVSFNAEYDALVGIGHACGHNLIAIMSLGAALATAKVAKDEGIGGKIVLFGTPAEGS